MSAYKNRVNAGLCGKCGGNREDKSASLCATCRKKEQQRAEKRREHSKANGLCMSCGSRPAVPGKKRCEICGAGSAASSRRARVQKKKDGECAHCTQPAMPGKTVCQACSDRMTKYSAERYHERRAEGKCNYCDNDPVPGATMCQYHLDQTAEQRARLKLEVLNAYGGPKCSWCPETDVRYLEIDHIEGGGRRHTEQIGGSGHALYSWLRTNNFPPGFRVLCRTCNNKSHVDRCRAADTHLNTNTNPASGT